MDLMKFEKHIPNKLYRYRSVNPDTLSALLNNRLFFSTSNYYDDPFDTLFCIDKSKLKNEIINLLINPNSQEQFNSFQKAFNMKLNFGIQDVLNNKEELFKWIDSYIQSIQYTFKNNIYSICFSESDLNQDLWLKYADNYTGFAIEYDVENIKKTYNETYTRDNKLMINTKNYLYPIVYNNKPFYANNLFKCILLRVAKLDSYINDWNRFLIDRRRVCLVKNKYHSNDKEWRVFVDNDYLNTNNDPSYINIVPKAVIMGLKFQNPVKYCYMKYVKRIK